MFRQTLTSDLQQKQQHFGPEILVNADASLKFDP